MREIEKAITIEDNSSSGWNKRYPRILVVAIRVSKDALIKMSPWKVLKEGTLF